MAVRSACADIIPAAPGPATITAAAAKAREGDTIQLAAGEYSDSVELPGGVILEGAGAGKTTLTATGYAAINCRGPGVKIAGLTIKPGEKTTRGINTSTPVRVERCRFVGVKEGVALMTAPLSDVVACEFINCGIGVRAIGEACPTVWGCVFKEGDTGVFSMEGMPYIRDNLFRGQRAGIRMVVGDEQPIMRNNLFLECRDAGIELLAKETPISAPSIRNAMFDGCGAAVTGDAGLLKSVSHCLIHEIKTATLKAGERSIVEADPGVAVDSTGYITLSHEDLAEGKGVKAGGDEDGRVAWVGLEQPWWHPGVDAPKDLPPLRFQPPDLVANAVKEEYQYLQLRKLGMGQQSTGKKDGKHFDTMSCSDHGKPLELNFDIGRFYDEMSIMP
jgi:hypothetical protein